MASAFLQRFSTALRSQQRRISRQRSVAAEALEPRQLLTLLGTQATVEVGTQAYDALVSDVGAAEIQASGYDFDFTAEGVQVTAGANPVGGDVEIHFDGFLADEFIANVTATQGVVTSVTGRSSIQLSIPQGQVAGDVFTVQIDVAEQTPSLIGAGVTVQNFYRTNVVGSELVPFEESERALVEDRADAEFSQFIGQYDIDLSANTISLVSNRSANPPAKPNSGTGLVDVYRFTFDSMSPDEFISSASADSTQALVPPVVVVDSNTIEVSIFPGQPVGPNFDALINVVVSEVSASVAGADFSVSQTTESNLGTGGTEVPFGNNQSGTINDAANFDADISALNGLINIDVDGDSIVVRSAGMTGILPTGSFERFYVTIEDSDFELSRVITTAASNGVRFDVTNDHTLLVELGPGTDLASFSGSADLDVELSGSLVTGQIAHDRNNNGQGGGWLNGWTVQLVDAGGTIRNTTTTHNVDLNNDGLIDPATESGVYIFEGVSTGNYTVQQVLQPDWVAVDLTDEGSQRLFDLDQQKNLRPASSNFLNWGGLNETWLLGNSGWHYITPDGDLFEWNMSPASNLSGNFVADVGQAAYANPALLHNAQEPANLAVNVQTPLSATGFTFANYLPAPAVSVALDTDTNDVVISWTPSGNPDATHDVWVTDLANRGPFLIDYGVEGNSLELNGLPDRPYRVWVRTQYSPGVFSPWSPFQDFEFFSDAVNPTISGLDAGIDATPTLSWTPVAGAVHYDLRVLANGQTVYQSDDINTTTHRIATALPLGEHEVQIRAGFATGATSEWSPSSTLIIFGRPEVQVNGTTVVWTAVDAATEYEIWVDRIDDQGQRLIRQALYRDGIQTTSASIAALPTGRYAIWLRAIRSEGGEQYVSFWSARVEHVITEFHLEFNEQETQLTNVQRPASERQQHVRPTADDRPVVRKDPTDSGTLVNDGHTLAEVMQQIATHGLPLS